MKTLAWLAEDLRLEDNPALTVALRDRGAVVRIEPEARGRPERTAGRRRVEAAAIERLAKTLRSRAIPLEIVSTDDPEAIERVRRQYCCDRVVRNIACGTPVENAHVARAIAAIEGAGAKVISLDGERPQPAHADLEPPADDPGHPIAQLRAFLKDLPTRGYRAGMWLPGRDRLVCSRLSTDLACGALSTRRAITETAIAERDWKRQDQNDRFSPQAREFGWFMARLQWRADAIAAFRGDSTEAPTLTIDEETTVRLKAWRDGKTGVPMADAPMRELAKTGWANFRMRQIAASFGTMQLNLPCATVAHTLAGLFDDYEPAITWIQVGLQAGLLAKERGPRIINPMKQGWELDPNEAYIRHWIPELEGVPAGFGHEPWRCPESKLTPPLVAPMAAAREARTRWKTPAGESKQASLPGLP
jgi:deoxyribodipyrimidine photolyase